MKILANELKPEVLIMYATGIVEQALRCGMLLVMPEPEPGAITNSLILRYANTRFRITVDLADTKEPGNNKNNGHT